MKQKICRIYKTRQELHAFIEDRDIRLHIKNNNILCIYVCI